MRRGSWTRDKERSESGERERMNKKDYFIFAIEL